MIDYSEIQKLAQHHINLHGDAWHGEESPALASVPTFAAEMFIAAANPAAVLELIAELQGYQQGAEAEASAADEARAAVRRLKAENSRLQGELHAAGDLIATYRRVNREVRSERDQIKAENERLRKIISESATACGAAVSVECSVEFMSMLPAEIESVVGGLRKDKERLQRFETAYKEFSDKTDWVCPDAAAHELGMHVADILRKRCDDLASHNQAQADEIVRLRAEAKDGLAVLRTQKQQLECYIKDADRWAFVRNPVATGSPFAIWKERTDLFLGRFADEAIDDAMEQEQQP